jgi:hypothetical protein
MDKTDGSGEQSGPAADHSIVDTYKGMDIRSPDLQQHTDKADELITDCLRLNGGLYTANFRYVIAFPCAKKWFS